MRLLIDVEHLDGVYAAEILPPDIIRWERKTGGKMAELQKRLGMDDLAFMAFASLSRQGLTKGNFDTWIDGLTALEPVAQEAPVPTSGDN
jgi:hypothetical protein